MAESRLGAIGFKLCSPGPHRSGTHDPRVLTMNGFPPRSRPIFPSRLGDDALPRGDRLRQGVHLLLTLYLLPAVLAVLVLGGLLVLLEGLARWVVGACGFVGALRGRGSRERFLMASRDRRLCDLAAGVEAHAPAAGQRSIPERSRRID